MNSRIRVVFGVVTLLVSFNCTLASQRIDPNRLLAIPQNQRANLVKRLNLYLYLVKKNNLSGLCKMYDKQSRCLRCAALKYRKTCPEPLAKATVPTTSQSVKEITPHWRFDRDRYNTNKYNVDVTLEIHTDAKGNQTIKDDGYITVTFERGKWYFSIIYITYVSL